MTTLPKRTLALVMGLTLLVFVGAGSASAAKKAPPNTGGTLTAPVTGTYTDPDTGATGTIAGAFTPTRFVNDGGDLTAIGSVTATLTDTATGTTQTVTEAASAVVAQAAGECQILDLVLGPLDLDLLGLVITLDTVHLNITAVQGPGNLLGNLLCAVAGLLNGPTGLNALVTQIANLLNQILGLLG